MDTMPGYKVAKDRITIMIGGNLAGDLKLKPLAVYRSQRPRAFKSININNLPVYWKSNTKGWVTRCIFVEWFNECFVPEVKQYCEKKEISFKVLLLLDNAPGHPIELNNMHPNVEILFLPPRTTSLLQPMDQGVVAALKSHYLRHTFEQALKTVETGSKTLSQFWKAFNILNAINNVAASWKEVKQATMQAAWKKIYPHFFASNEPPDSSQEPISTVLSECVSLAHFLEIEVNYEEMEELVNCAGEPLSNEELIKMQSLEILEEYLEDDSEGMEEENKCFSTKGLAEAFSNLELALSTIEAMDSDEERFARVSNSVRENMKNYLQIWEDKKKSTEQLTMDNFLITL